MPPRLTSRCEVSISGSGATSWRARGVGRVPSITSAAPTANTASARICGSHGRRAFHTVRAVLAPTRTGARSPEAAAMATEISSGTM